MTAVGPLCYACAMTENYESGNEPQTFDEWVAMRVMNGVLSVDDYDELRDW